MNDNGFSMGGAWVFWLLIVVGIVLLAIWAVRAFGSKPAPGPTGEQGPGTGQGTPKRSSAREALDQRFARGELSAEDYQERVRVLGEDT